MFLKDISFFALLAIISIVNAGENETKPENHFTFLGKFTKSSVNARQRSTIQQTSYYFLSQNAAAWSTAANDCKANLGDTASLLNIETGQEQEKVISFLQNSDDTGSTYWTGGKYDSGIRAFIWDNGVEILSSAPWDKGYPNVKTPLTRVFLRRAGSVGLRTDFQTVSLRYICELTF